MATKTSADKPKHPRGMGRGPNSEKADNAFGLKEPRSWNPTDQKFGQEDFFGSQWRGKFEEAGQNLDGRARRDGVPYDDKGGVTQNWRGPVKHQVELSSSTCSR